MASGVSPRRPAPAWMDPEAQIAKMLGCTVKRVRAYLAGVSKPEDGE